MTLEQLVPPLYFMEDTLIPNSPSQKRRYLTLPHSPKYSDSKPNTITISNGLNVNRHRGLSRTASDNSFLTRTLPIRSCSTWVSTDSSGYNNDMESSLNTRFISTVDVKLTHNNNLSSAHAYKTDRVLRHSSLKERSSAASKRNISTSGPQATERITKSRLDKSLIYKPILYSGEILLDFPANDQSHNVKRSEKSRDLKLDRGHPSLHHSASMPGLSDSFMKESRPDLASAKLEPKSRPFFLFFRKKNKTGDDRSPSPSVKSNHLNIPRCPSNLSSRCPSNLSSRCPSNLSSTHKSRAVSQRTASPSSRGRRSAGQSPVSPRFYLNSVSSNVPCTPSSPPSMCSPTETTSNSPTSTDKFPRYIPRSRSKRRREAGRKIAEREQVQPDDRLTLEDLPPHPSLLKQPLGKTNSFPCTPVIRSSSIKFHTNHRSEAVSAIRRNSLPESHTEMNIKYPSSERRNSRKDSKVDSSQNFRKKSLESSSKSTSENDSQREMTGSKYDQKPISLVRSKSVPSFEADFYLPGTDTRVISDAEDFEYSPTDMTGRLHLSLCGCGFLGMYHLGVISCLTQRSPTLLERVEKVGGASAGAIMAALLVTCPDKAEESAEHIQNLAKEIRRKPLGPLTPGYNFTRSLRCMLDDVLPENAHQTAQGKLFVSVTNSDTKKNEMLSEFSSRDELIETLVSSCYVPVYAGIKPATIRGKKYIDGGLSNNMPIFETGRTITVSPFDGKSDIGPKAGQEAEKKANFINVQNQDLQVSVNNAKKSAQAFFPPKHLLLQEYFEKGRYDASRFLVREGLYEISATTQKKITLYESSV